MKQASKSEPLRLTNTLTRKKESFKPIIEGQVSIYCCGVTVYDLCHLGHARSYIAWDILRRFLIWKGYKVMFVQNFTDIDDKILARAANEGTSMEEVSERNINAFFKDMDALGILRADRMPRATKCLDGIRSFISELIDNGFAYSVNGDVYFEVARYSEYGKLSGRDLIDQQSNADGRLSEFESISKRHPFDFALWKKAKDGEPSFPSKWGKGRPGWHIECSAMVKKELGETIDIHLGGADLVFPHHENELAQSEAANGKSLARFWLHNGMVNVGGQKMSKSLGNFTTIRDLLAQGISPMSLRMFVLQAHYRKPLDFNDESLRAAATGWKKLNIALSLGTSYSKLLGWKDKFKLGINDSNLLDIEGMKVFSTYISSFDRFLNDDLNTSAALAVLFDLANPLASLANSLERKVDNCMNQLDLQSLNLRWILLIELAKVLGLEYEKGSNIENDRLYIDQKEIEEAILLRKEAKVAGNYDKADSIRESLKRKGIELIDKKGDITEWIRI